MIVRDDAEQFEALAPQAAPGKFGNEFDFVRENLVENHANDLDAFALEDGLVQIDFIYRFADPALADNNNFRPQNFRDSGVGQIKDGANAGRVPNLRRGQNPSPRRRDRKLFGCV